jgi:hypothetical protein
VSQGEEPVGRRSPTCGVVHLDPILRLKPNRRDCPLPPERKGRESPRRRPGVRPEEADPIVAGDQPRDDSDRAAKHRTHDEVHDACRPAVQRMSAREEAWEEERDSEHRSGR